MLVPVLRITKLNNLTYCAMRNQPSSSADLLRVASQLKELLATKVACVRRHRVATDIGQAGLSGRQAGR